MSLDPENILKTGIRTIIAAIAGISVATYFGNPAIYVCVLILAAGWALGLIHLEEN